MIKIAIDGPSGAGKSTIAKAVAKRLGYVYVDTGALYRTIGWAALSENLNCSDAQQIMPLLKRIQVDLTYENGVQKVLLNGTDVSTEIRLPQCSMSASAVSAIPAVREFLLTTQRSIASHHNVIMDGRDIGTVVLPDAQVKIFLTASAEDRAQRRYEELCEKGVATTFEEVLADMKQRDYNDSHRDIAPLKPAEDSILVDTSNNTLEQSIDAIYNTILSALPAGAGK